MPVDAQKDAIQAVGQPTTPVLSLLKTYNGFTQFIDRIRNAPVALLSQSFIVGYQSRVEPLSGRLNAMVETLLSRASQPLLQGPCFAPFIDVVKAGHALRTAENLQLLNALYQPAPFPPPEIEDSEFSKQMAYFLSFAGLSATGIPVEFNRQVLRQLSRALAQAGALRGVTANEIAAQCERPLLLFLSSRLTGRYITPEMAVFALIPMLKQANTLINGLGTALYHIMTCNPLRLAFPDTADRTGWQKDTRHAQQQAAPLTPDAETLPGYRLPGMAPCYGPPSAIGRYEIAPQSSAFFCGHYRATPGGYCVNAPSENGSAVGFVTAGVAGYARVWPQQRQIALAMTTGRLGVTLDTAGAWFLDLSAPVATGVSPARPAFDAQSLTVDSIMATLTRGIQRIERRMSIIGRVYAQPQADYVPHRWHTGNRAPRAINSVPLPPDPSDRAKNNTPNIERIFPNEYVYDDITRRYKPLFIADSTDFTLIDLVKAMLDDVTVAWLCSDKEQIMPVPVQRFYACANLDMRNQSRTWAVNGYINYIFHLLKIENIFDEQGGGELYYLLKRFGYIDAALSFELKRFIKIKSGSDYIDKRLADIIAILAFPFHLLKNKAYHTHEMRGWKLMLGLLIEQYFPQEKRGKPLERCNEFIYLITDVSVTPADRKKFRSMLTHPPLSFVVQLMAQDLLHERLSENNLERVIELLSTFHLIDKQRTQALKLSSHVVVEQIYAFYKDDNTLAKNDRINIIRDSLISSVELTLRFIIDNWFNQSRKGQVKVGIQIIILNCWIKGAARSLSNNNLFQGGVVSFEFNTSKYLFFIDDSGSCSFLGPNESEARADMLNNKKFFKEGDIKSAFLEKTGYEFEQIDGGLDLSFSELGSFIVDDDFSEAATCFVDRIAFSSARKNKLIGSTFLTRMEDWARDISLASFIPLWGCYDGFRSPSYDNVEKNIVCSFEAPTLSLVAKKGVELTKTVKSLFSFRPQDLFSEATDTLSSSRTLFMSPARGITLSSEVPTEIFTAKDTSAATHTIARLHGSSIESFSTYATAEQPVYYFGSARPILLHTSDSFTLPINSLEISASMGDLASTFSSFSGRVSLNSQLIYSDDGEPLAFEDDIRRFLDIVVDRRREHQRQSIQATLAIVEELSNIFLANIPGMITRKVGAKAFAYSLLMVATLEVIKASILAWYNEDKHGGYQDTNVVDFQLKFIDKIKMQLAMNISSGEGRHDQPRLIERSIPLSEEETREVIRQGVVPLPVEERINTRRYASVSALAYEFNQSVMDILLLGLPLPREPMRAMSLTQSTDNSLSLPSRLYFKTLSLEPENFLALLTYRYGLDYVLDDVPVSCVSCLKGPGKRQEYIRLADALVKYKNTPAVIRYPALINRQLQQALEEYRHARVADYVREYNRVHALQYLRLGEQQYLNADYAQLREYLFTRKKVELADLEITQIDFQPFRVWSGKFIELCERVIPTEKARPFITLLPENIPADVALMLHQYLHATPEQRLGERASCIAQNRQSGLGIGIVKSAVTPYYTLPAALFFTSRLLRYGLARKDWEALTFEFSSNGQVERVSLMGVLAGRLHVYLKSQPLLRGNKMLRREIAGYCRANAALQGEERQNIELYYAIYRRDAVYLAQTDEFIRRIAQRYGVEETLTQAAEVLMIDAYGSQRKTLLAALDDKTDNAIIGYPVDWPAEARNELDVYRDVRFGNLIAWP